MIVYYYGKDLRLYLEKSTEETHKVIKEINDCIKLDKYNSLTNSQLEYAIHTFLGYYSYIYLIKHYGKKGEGDDFVFEVKRRKLNAIANGNMNKAYEILNLMPIIDNFFKDFYKKNARNINFEKDDKEKIEKICAEITSHAYQIIVEVDVSGNIESQIKSILKEAIITMAIFTSENICYQFRTRYVDFFTGKEL